MLHTVLTGISEVEVVFNIAGEVVTPPELWPMCVWLLIVSDENSKQDNHSNLPDKADSWQTNTHIGVLLPAEKITKTLTTVPHDDESLLMMLGSLLSQDVFCCDLQQHPSGYIWAFQGVCPISPLTHRGWMHLTCYQVNHSLSAIPSVTARPSQDWQHIPHRNRYHCSKQVITINMW